MLGRTMGWAVGIAAMAIGATDRNAGGDSADPAKRIAQDARTMTIAGHCLDQESRPVARARVQLYLQDSLRFVEELRASALTGKDGSFRFEGLPRFGREDRGAHRWVVVAEATGRAHGVATVRWEETPAGELEIVMSPPGIVNGMVTD